MLLKLSKKLPKLNFDIWPKNSLKIFERLEHHWQRLQNENRAPTEIDIFFRTKIATKLTKRTKG